MKEGDMSFEAGVGWAPDGLWGWAAKGAFMAEFYKHCQLTGTRLAAAVHPSGRVGRSLFRNRRAAERSLDKFQRAYLGFVQAKFPSLRSDPSAGTI
jgi:hypothetical protein